MTNRKPGRTLGIDPCSLITGFGVLERNGAALTHIYSGYVRVSAWPSLPVRLQKIYQAVKRVIADHQPTEAAVEKVFYSKNVQSALTLGQVRGVAILAAVEAGLELFEYSPLEIKKAVTGYGRAEKGQVQKMIQLLLHIAEFPTPDVSDALAVALCHVNWLYPAIEGRS
jgi:crossover junction endodeoxyribonuclease RuvC